jgi:Domain of unknown function (DUF4129)
MTCQPFLLAAPGFLLAAPAPPPPEQIRRQLSEVLARPEFSPQDSFSFWRTLGEALFKFFRWLGTLWTANPPLFWVILIGCIALLILMIALIVFQVRAALGGGSGRAKGKAAAAAERVRRSRACRDEALRRAAAGEYTEAIRYLFLSLVYRFDESGRVSFQKAYTNREYLSLLDARLPVREQLRVFVDTLDDHWYGQRPSDRPQYERCLQIYEQLAA